MLLRKSRKALRIAILAGSLLGLIASIGCSAKQVVIHPIEQTDIILLEAGDTFVAPKPGAFLSDLYIEEVMRARVGR